MNWQAAREENDTLLGHRLDEIRKGELLTALVPFARCYLGMFHDLDNELPGRQRIALLANESLCDAILQGFVALLSNTALPAAQEIARQPQEAARLGYVVLAGMDYLVRNDAQTAAALPKSVLQSALCFHFSLTPTQDTPWVSQLLRRSELASGMFSEYWRALLQRGERVLPGYLRVFRSNQLPEVASRVVIPLLTDWSQCRKPYLKEMLYAAFAHGHEASLLSLARDKLAQAEQLDETSRVYWYGCAFLLASEEFANPLAGYIGRVKQKALPLLDFVIGLVRPDLPQSLPLSANAVAQLLRILGPVFPPQSCTYGTLGWLDVNSQNVMWLMYLLASYHGSAGSTALKTLRKARTMRIYAACLDYVAELQQKAVPENDPLPTYSEFVDVLINEHKLDGRSKRQGAH